MDWLLAQAQTASPFVAVFCLAAVGIGGRVVVILWRQLLFERTEHRKAEKDSTAAANRLAGVMEKLAAKLERPRP